jgi:hypothetical protein
VIGNLIGWVCTATAGDLLRGVGTSDDEDDGGGSHAAPSFATLPAPYADMHAQTDSSHRVLMATVLARASLAQTAGDGSGGVFLELTRGVLAPAFAAVTAGRPSGVPPEVVAELQALTAARSGSSGVGGSLSDAAQLLAAQVRL